jgi:hypothetical protein
MTQAIQSSNVTRSTSSSFDEEDDSSVELGIETRPVKGSLVGGAGALSQKERTRMARHVLGFPEGSTQNEVWSRFHWHARIHVLSAQNER